MLDVTVSRRQLRADKLDFDLVRRSSSPVIHKIHFAQSMANKLDFEAIDFPRQNQQNQASEIESESESESEIWMTENEADGKIMPVSVKGRKTLVFCVETLRVTLIRIDSNALDIIVFCRTAEPPWPAVKHMGTVILFASAS